jgi:hypothetical protein
LPFELPPTPEHADYAAAPRRFMSILDFEALLDQGISCDQLSEHRHAKVSGMEDFPEYVNYLHVLGAIRYSSGRFIRA